MQIALLRKREARNRSSLSILKHSTSQRCQSSALVQKRIGKLAMRKYKLANSVNCSLYTCRRLITTCRPRRTASEMELIFKESTNLAAALLRASGISRSAGLVPLFPICIGDFLFDPMAFRGRVNLRG
jgi:hypothetical protein